MLVDQQDSNVLPVLGVLLECRLDSTRLRLCSVSCCKSRRWQLEGESHRPQWTRSAHYKPPFKFQIPTAIDDKEVLLLLVIHVADAREEESGDGVLLSA